MFMSHLLILGLGEVVSSIGCRICFGYQRVSIKQLVRTSEPTLLRCDGIPMGTARVPFRLSA